MNNDQRRIPLRVVSRKGNTATLQLHSNTNVALTGMYYLFAVDGNGVPSVGKDIQIDFGLAFRQCDVGGVDQKKNLVR